MIAAKYTELAENVMQKIADYLFKYKIAHDTGDGCVYFNDKKEKKTYRVVFEECPHYEGD